LLVVFEQLSESFLFFEPMFHADGWTKKNEYLLCERWTECTWHLHFSNTMVILSDPY
jgi:hypothetical protein